MVMEVLYGCLGVPNDFMPTWQNHPRESLAMLMPDARTAADTRGQGCTSTDKGMPSAEALLTTKTHRRLLSMSGIMSTRSI